MEYKKIIRIHEIYFEKFTWMRDMKPKAQNCFLSFLRCTLHSLPVSAPPRPLSWISNCRPFTGLQQNSCPPICIIFSIHFFIFNPTAVPCTYIHRPFCTFIHFVIKTCVIYFGPGKY